MSFNVGKYSITALNTEKTLWLVTDHEGESFELTGMVGQVANQVMRITAFTLTSR